MHMIRNFGDLMWLNVAWPEGSPLSVLGPAGQLWLARDPVIAAHDHDCVMSMTATCDASRPTCLKYSSSACSFSASGRDGGAPRSPMDGRRGSSSRLCPACRLCTVSCGGRAAVVSHTGGEGGGVVRAAGRERGARAGGCTCVRSWLQRSPSPQHPALSLHGRGGRVPTASW